MTAVLSLLWDAIASSMQSTSQTEDRVTDKAATKSKISSPAGGIGSAALSWDMQRVILLQDYLGLNESVTQFCYNSKAEIVLF